MIVNFSYTYQDNNENYRYVQSCKKYDGLTKDQAIEKLYIDASKKGVTIKKIGSVLEPHTCHVCGKPASFKNENDPNWYCWDHK